MVEAGDSVATQVWKSYGAMNVICEFLDIKEIVPLQQVCKAWYDLVIPRARTKVSMPCLQLVLERSRTKISIGHWRDNMRHCSE